MKNLIIEATEYTPKIDFNYETNVLELKGECYPENINILSVPISDWIEEYLQQLKKGQTCILNIELTYFNSSSSKMLANLFDMLEKDVEENGTDIVINWIYQEDDDMSEEYGEEFQEDLESLTFSLVSK